MMLRMSNSFLACLVALVVIVSAKTIPKAAEASQNSTMVSKLTRAPTIILEEPSMANNVINNASTSSTSQDQQTGKPPLENVVPKSYFQVVWECPNITGSGIECSCDLPHTLRCTGDSTALKAISAHLRHSRPGMISLLDVTVTGISLLPANFLEDVALHGLVVSTGQLEKVHENAFTTLARPLQALGLPNNLLEVVPIKALSKLNGLERLDLSHNRMKTLEATSFQGLTNVTYLDLCNNLLSQLSPQAFVSLPGLRILKMRENQLTVAALSALRGLRNLEELDLSNNKLEGPLGQSFLPPMTRLRILKVSENELKIVKNGSLLGLKNLSSLTLSHNKIDVLEDHAFKHLSSLTHLDLASNGIVTVSSLSLAHLENLKSLDLTHNFLRSLNGDLILPLRSLEELRLDDNDITMVTADVANSKLKLKRLSLVDNPLNCDCTLLEFAHWLSNSSSLDEEDKNSAVCATPPNLENGVLTQVSPGSLLCGEPMPQISTRPPVASAQLTLNEFHYDVTTGVDLLWKVDPCNENYTCDNLIIYETIGDQEGQIASYPLHCDSRVMRDPCFLPVSIPTSLRLEPGHRYRYCVVLMVASGLDDVSLGLGCSDVMKLDENFHLAPEDEEENEDDANRTPEVSDVKVNVSNDGFLRIEVSLQGQPSSDCEIDLDIFATETASIHRKRLNCSSGSAALSGLLPGRYRVCASIDQQEKQVKQSRWKKSSPVVPKSSRDHVSSARCVEVQTFRQSAEILLLLITGMICACGILAFVAAKNLLKKPRKDQVPPQCFMPAQEVEITHKTHYIKLLATTKV